MSSAESTHNGNNQCKYDCIIVGGGGVGTAAAYQLMRAAHNSYTGTGKTRVLLLEQFSIGHTRGSSHGGSRIIRYTHDAVSYARQMPQTFALWRELEQTSGETLLQMSGGLYMGPPDQPFIVGAQDALAALDFPYTLYDAFTLPSHFPQFALPTDWVALYQEHTGMLAATRCVQTLAREAVRLGATLQEHTRVTALHPVAGGSDGSGVAMEVTAQGPAGQTTYWGEQVILCAGPWAPHFLAELLPQPLPLRVTHQQVVYYAVPNAADYAPGCFPVFLCTGDEFIYGLPIWERPGEIKVALETESHMIDPDVPERPLDQEMLHTLNQSMPHYLPHITPEPLHTETCLYTETPSRDFIIDRHPAWPQLILAAGFSGRGFKHTIAIGRLLADLAACAPGEYQSDFWLDNYRLDHFLAPAVS